jgi:hypothetical protein
VLQRPFPPASITQAGSSSLLDPFSKQLIRHRKSKVQFSLKCIAFYKRSASTYNTERSTLHPIHPQEQHILARNSVIKPDGELVIKQQPLSQLENFSVHSSFDPQTQTPPKF